MFEQAHLLKLIVLLVSYSSATSVIYNVSPTLESCSVHREPCVTLSQFAANSSQYLQSNTTVTLVLLEGDHTLNTQLMVEGIIAFFIHSQTGLNVTCENGFMMYLRNIGDVQLHNVTFRECKIEVNAVKNFFMINIFFTDFDDTFDEFRVLLLEQTNATILNTTFKIFMNITSGNGILVAISSTVTIREILFDNNIAYFGFAFYHSMVLITQSSFNNNEVSGDSKIWRGKFSHTRGGILYFDKNCSITITASNFTNNIIRGFSDTECTILRGPGGVIITLSRSVEFKFCNFLNNTGSGYIKGGAIHIYIHNQLLHGVASCATIYIHGCIFTNNSAFTGGAVYMHCDYKNDNSIIDISNSNFIENVAQSEGGAVTIGSAHVSIQRSLFLGNVVLNLKASSTRMRGKRGAVSVHKTNLKLFGNKFNNNKAAHGGAVYVFDCNNVFVFDAKFAGNCVNNGNGGAIAIKMIKPYLYTSARRPINITKGSYINNMATGDGGGLYVERGFDSSSTFISSNNFSSNQAKLGSGGALALVDVEEVTVNTNEFDHNLANNGGALSVMLSSYRCCSHSVITNISQCSFSYNRAVRGGAIYMVASRPVYFYSNIIAENLADYGGAVFSDSSRLHVSSKLVTMTNNSAQFSGGAVYLNNSELMCQNGGMISLERNKAKYQGGGIYSSSSSLIINSTVKLPYFINLSQNLGEEGGGLYLCKGSKINIHIFSDAATYIYFTNNRARFGHDLFIFDENFPDTFLPNTSISQCFIQVSQSYSIVPNYTKAIHFENDTLINVMKTNFGICKVGQQLAINELDNLKRVSNIQDPNIDSLSFRLCFCKDGFPDCTYKPPAREMKTFSVEVAMANQFSRMISTNITSDIDGGLLPGNKKNQRIKHSCTDLNFTVYSQSYVQELVMTPHCKTPYHCFNDQIKLSVHVNACIFCPIGFEMLSDEIKGCDCVCDSALMLSGYIVDCDYSTGVILKQHSTAWISYISKKNSSGYLIYHYCPHNYCLPPETMVEINLNLSNGADAQCSNNRGGLLCGACINGSTLSIGNAKCIECDTHWWVVLVVLIICGTLGGIILVASLLVLNLTVAVGTLNGIIFYANIVTTSSNIFFPTNNFLTVFTSWINLELGIDTCLFKGMDAYWKTWIELAFPTYLIALVIIIIIASEKSKRFSNLIGKKNPVATLDTLILLSYVKFLRVIISSYSFAILDYPDHSRRLVWLPDATVQYFSGKHTPLFIAATLVLLVGVAYTSLLLSWQWLLRYQDVKCLALIRNQHLRLFMVPYHAPYKPNHRYWTGLSLLVRIILYVISAATLSLDPTINIVAVGIATSILLLLSTNRPYNKRPIELLEIVSLTNINCFCITTIYVSKAGGQNTVGFISGSVTLLLFLIVLGYHVLTEICFKTQYGRSLKQKFEHKFNITDNYEDSEEVCGEEARIPITYSEVPAPKGDSNCAERKGEVRHTKRKNAFELKMQNSPNSPVPYHLMQ